MIAYDYHLHTSYCDGKATVEQMVEAAKKKKLSYLGFSGHSYVSFDTCCMTEEDTGRYISEVRNLADRYKDKMTILCGLEKDYYSNEDESRFDYTIGSVHYLELEGVHYPIDMTSEIQSELIVRHFDRDPYAFVHAYYQTVADLFSRVKADVIGHFDLITKFAATDPLFDINHPRYKRAWQNALDALLPYNKPFEINTGAISRGWRKTPYPKIDILRYIFLCGGRILLSSDSHDKDTLCYGFKEAKRLARSVGFTSTFIPVGKGEYREIPLS